MQTKSAKYRKAVTASPVVLALILAVFAWLSGGSSVAAQSKICQRIEFNGDSYLVCEADLRRNRVELFWKDKNGDAFASLSNLRRELQTREEPVVMTMNGGMYHAELDPVGLYVERGRQMVRASTSNGPGNFHLKPNGVFYIADGKAGVLETGQYLRRGVRPEFATQSGPMLVINNRIHPKFPAEGVSRKIRNGVGVKDDTTVFFAISESGVTFTDFAKLFKDRLGATNALFLDGSVSALSAPGFERGGFRSLGPMIGVFERRMPDRRALPSAAGSPKS
jgi:prepilin-type processing-associated H-X9-DG protein